MTLTPLTSFRSAFFWLTLALLVAEVSLVSAKADTLPVDTGFRAPSFTKATPPQRALLLADGKYLLFFEPDTLTDTSAGPIVRFLPDGSLDTSFNFSREYKNVSAAVPTADGRLYVAATRYLYGVKDTEQILRLNADGSIDPTFAAVTVGGTNSVPDVRRLVIQSDGKLLVGGFFLSFAGDSTRRGIVRLLPNGAVDSGFTPPVINGNVYSLTLQADAKILMGGSFSTVNSVARPGITRLKGDGTVDASFVPSGFTRLGPNRGIAIQADGQIIVCGQLRTGSGPFVQVPLVRISPTGALDPSFNSAGVAPGSSPIGRDLVIQPDGKIVAIVDSNIIRFTTTGSYDSTFRQPVFVDATITAAIPPVGTPTTVQLYSNGQVFVGGAFTDVDPPAEPGLAHLGVAWLDSTGNVDPTLVSTHHPGNEIAPSSFLRLTDGSTLVTFTETADPPIPYNLARLLADGSRDPSFALSSPDPDRFLTDFTAHGIEPLPDGNFFVYGAFGWGKVRPDGTEDTTFASNDGLPMQQATVAPDGKILLTSGKDAQTLAFSPFTYGRLLANGQIDSFSGGFNGQVIRNTTTGSIEQMNVGTRVLAVQTDGKVLLEYFASDKKSHLIRLNADGSVDGTFTETILTPAEVIQEFPFIFDPFTGTSYQPPLGVSSAISLLDAYVQTDGRIILTGHFLTFGGSSARGIVRINSNGSVDNTFHSGTGAQWTDTDETAMFYPTVENIEPTSDGKFLITGTFEAFNETPFPGMARLNPDGSVDTSFVAPVQRDKRSRTASSFRAQPDGSYLLSGPYTFAGESTPRSLIRLGGLAPNVGNISTRLAVGTDDNALIEGFIVQGPAGSSKKILVRAIGPSLTPFGVPDALANPTLEIHDASGATVATNNDWQTTQIGGLITGNQFAEINSSGLAPGNNLESAIIVSLVPGSYTAVVRGAGNTAGTGVVDAFDLAPGSAARLANIATRGLVQPGDRLMIAGFIVQNGPLKVVVRAIGPSLVPFGIPNALPDTTLQLRDQQGALVLENDDWRSGQEQELISLGLQPSDDLEAALVSTLQPGQYTAQVRGKGQATGIGVVQVYFIP